MLLERRRRKGRATRMKYNWHSSSELGEPPESPFPLGRYFSRDANFTSAGAYHSICQRSTSRGSSSLPRNASREFQFLLDI
jgi:hypothetical protein